MSTHHSQGIHRQVHSCGRAEHGQNSEHHRKSSFSTHRTKNILCMQLNYGESETMNTLDCDSKV